MNRLLTLLATIALAGCGEMSGSPPPTIQSADAVTRSTEQGGRFVSIVGPHRQHAEPFLGVPNTNFYALRSWIDTRNGETAHQLYVEDSYFGAERNWNAAHGGNGEPLKFVPISKNEISCENTCSYAEEFAATLPEALLRASTGGLTVTFSSAKGETKTISVPGKLVQEQVTAVEEARRPPKTAALDRPR